MFGGRDETRGIEADHIPLLANDHCHALRPYPRPQPTSSCTASTSRARQKPPRNMAPGRCSGPVSDSSPPRSASSPTDLSVSPPRPLSFRLYSYQRPTPCRPCPRSTRRPRTSTCAPKTSTLSCVAFPSSSLPTGRVLIPVRYLLAGLQGQGYGPVREVNTSSRNEHVDLSTDGRAGGDAPTAGTWDTIRACLLLPRLSVPVYGNNKLHYRQAAGDDLY